MQLEWELNNESFCFTYFEAYFCTKTIQTDENEESRGDLQWREKLKFDGILYFSDDRGS